MQTDDIFGDKTWTDLRRVLAGYLWHRFYDISPDDVDDACGVAMVDLFDYWMDLPSSVTDDKRRNWAFALWRAKHIGAKFLHNLLKERVQFPSYDAWDEDDDDGGHWIQGVTDPEPLDEDEQRTEKIREVLGSMPEDDLQEWLYPVLVGESERGQARRQGTNKTKVHNARVLGRNKLYGILVNTHIY